MVKRHPHLQLIAPSASPEETAAIVAAVERFRRATAPPTAPTGGSRDEWLRAAILEGVSGGTRGDDRDPWINT
jgi:hypothetical protein